MNSNIILKHNLTERKLKHEVQWLQWEFFFSSVSSKYFCRLWTHKGNNPGLLDTVNF